MKKVVIFGGGIGGLVAAHRLSEDDTLEIHVYERHSTPGGQARSVGDGIRDFSEYCWHVFGNGYIHLLPILQEIPYEDGFVSDHLVGMNQFIYGRYPKDKEHPGIVYDEMGNSFVTSKNIFDFLKRLWKAGGKFSITDIFLILKAVIIGVVGSDRRLDSYADVLWSDYMSGLSEEARKWIVDSPSIYMGKKTDDLSAQMMLKMFRRRKNLSEEGFPCDFYSLDGPIHKILFKPWVAELEARGVIFHFDQEIQNVKTSGTKMISFMTQDYEEITGDIFVNSLGVEEWARINDLNLDYSFRFSTLADYGRQIQCHILYRIPSKIQLQGPCIIILPDTEWCVMVRVEGSVWRGEWELPDDIDLLSAGIGIWHRKGTNGKTAMECTREELAEEVWTQINKNDGLAEYLKLANKETFASLSFEIPEYDIWESYVFDLGEVDTYEPKFSNGIGTLSLRPDVLDDTYANVYHANAYTRTEINIFCMESAAEAGVKAARLIRGLELPETRDKSGWWDIFRKADEYLFSLF